ncbi:hypothetical protein OPV22_034312 [Ensete ventricosum]|uniref:Uncharacterized protein n=1 Tax=Ensete ventricosum TaxID=4639 RepID=A0AAV8PS62_ENSVE|nr:hypothetical protein OPV22_034312 [Ensete ventricosum]
MLLQGSRDPVRDPPPTSRRLLQARLLQPGVLHLFGADHTRLYPRVVPHIDAIEMLHTCNQVMFDDVALFLFDISFSMVCSPIVEAFDTDQLILRSHMMRF